METIVLSWLAPKIVNLCHDGRKINVLHNEMQEITVNKQNKTISRNHDQMELAWQHMKINSVCENRPSLKIKKSFLKQITRLILNNHKYILVYIYVINGLHVICI